MAGRKKTVSVGHQVDPLSARRREGINVQIDFSSKQWWTKEGLAYIERAAPASVLRLARNYVRDGRVLDVDVQPGMIEAKVQGGRQVPYHVRLLFPLPGEDELLEIKRRLSERALYGALLLSGEVPTVIEDIFLASGSHFMPLGKHGQRFFCGCSSPDDLCEHIVAVLYAAAGIFDRDPFLLLKLRGLGGDDLLSSILVPRRDACAGMGDACPSEDFAGTERETESAASLTAFSKVDPLPLDAAFYGGDSICEAIEEFRNSSMVRTDVPASLVPLFDFPLWRGEVSFKESLDPYYESARRLSRKI